MYGGGFRRARTNLNAFTRSFLKRRAPKFWQDDGQVTYVTRSKWMGFPDYTTVRNSEEVLELWARSRFGQSDLGVNRARVEDWLQRLEADEG